MTHARQLRKPRSAAGFTMYEIVVALFLLGLVLLAAWTMFGAAGDRQLAGWREADRRSELAAAERSLTATLLEAGASMPSSPGMGGVHVARAGAGADTLYVLRGAGPRLRVAARQCRSSGETCLVVIGDRRRDLRAGAVVIVGTSGGGLRVMRVAAAPAAFSGACGADCAERVLCTLVRVEGSGAPAVAGSVLQPPDAEAPTPSPEPCVQPVLADGTRCAENPVEAPGPVLAPGSCATTGPAVPYTEVRLEAAGASWGLPEAPVPPPLRAGAGGFPAPLLQEVSVTRFWVRMEDSTLVKQSDPGPGGWAKTQPLAARVVSFTVDLLHAGAPGWTRGLALPDRYLDHGAHNENFVRAAGAADGAPRAWRFRTGYHTVAAVRVNVGLLRPDGPGAWRLDRRSLVVGTPAIVAGARAEGGS